MVAQDSVPALGCKSLMPAIQHSTVPNLLQRAGNQTAAPYLSGTNGNAACHKINTLLSTPSNRILVSHLSAVERLSAIFGISCGSSYANLFMLSDLPTLCQKSQARMYFSTRDTVHFASQDLSTGVVVLLNAHIMYTDPLELLASLPAW